jgi:hypothetical protein
MRGSSRAGLDFGQQFSAAVDILLAGYAALGARDAGAGRPAPPSATAGPGAAGR